MMIDDGLGLKRQRVDRLDKALIVINPVFNFQVAESCRR